MLGTRGLECPITRGGGSNWKYPSRERCVEVTPDPLDMIDAMEIGEGNLGKFAREGRERARRDPRLGRGRGAMIDDFWAALDEAERTRAWSILGLNEVRDAYEREKSDSSLEGTPLEAAKGGQLQAIWERSEVAKAEIANDYAALNVQALVAMNSALDALVEEFVPAVQDMQVEWFADEVLMGVDGKPFEAAGASADEVRSKMLTVLPDLLKMPKIDRLRGSGIRRYETLLAQVDLAAPADRPIPADLDEALTELGAIRDVRIHRAGRVDQKALDQSPTLRYEAGALVRLSRDDYRQYSAAIRCYAKEIIYRPLRHWPATDDEKHGPDLAGWRRQCMAWA